MANTSSRNVYDDFFQVAQSGDEQGSREFLLNYIKRFSKEDQDAIMMAFFEEALQKRIDDVAVVADFQKEVTDTFKGLEDTKRKLEDKDRLLEIKETI